MTKKQLKNMAKTGGKYTLKGVKLLGRGALTVTELGAKATGTVAKGVAHNYDVRKFVTGVGSIAANVAFLGPSLGITAMNYLIQNCAMGKSYYSPVDALRSTLRMTEGVLNGAIGLVAEPVAAVSKGIENVSKKGKDILEK